MPKPDDIVSARRKKGYGNVMTDLGEWREGEVIPMRYEEAKAREDCMVVEEPEPKKEIK